MKTEELKDLGLTDEQISGVFKLNGMDIQSYKDIKVQKETLEKNYESLKDQLDTANKTIEDFKGVDLEGLNSQIDDYKKKYEESELKRKKEIENLKLDNFIDKGLFKAGSRNNKAIKSLLDMDALRESKNVSDDLTAQIKGLKETDPYLFKDSESQDTQAMGKANATPKKKLEDMTYLEMLEAHKKGIL